MEIITEEVFLHNVTEIIMEIVKEIVITYCNDYHPVMGIVIYFM